MNFNKRLCQEMRKRIRANIHIKARECLDYRCVFGEKDLLIGGVVFKKNRKVAHIERQDEVACVTKLMSWEEYQKMPLEERRSDDVAYDDVVLYDFSGMMEVSTAIDDKDARIKMHLLNVGDIFYVIGRIIALNSPEGFFIKAKDVLRESDLKFYQFVNSEYLNQIKKDAKKLLSRPVAFESSHVLFCYRSTGEILRYFLREGSQVSVFNYMDLASAFYSEYSPFANKRIRGAVRRLFLRSFRQMNGINPERFLEEHYSFDETRRK